TGTLPSTPDRPPRLRTDRAFAVIGAALTFDLDGDVVDAPLVTQNPTHFGKYGIGIGVAVDARVAGQHHLLRRQRPDVQVVHGLQRVDVFRQLRGDALAVEVTRRRFHQDQRRAVYQPPGRAQHQERH